MFLAVFLFLAPNRLESLVGRRVKEFTEIDSLSKRADCLDGAALLLWGKMD
jgi:hypothetical protein